MEGSHVVVKPAGNALSPLGETALLYSEEVCGLVLPQRLGCHMGALDGWPVGINVPGFTASPMLLTYGMSAWAVDVHMHVRGFTQHPGHSISPDG
eukprot:5626401-Amphidinium_carterae.1